jgi:TolB-like protein
MLPFERKASASCIERAIVVNGRISCFAALTAASDKLATAPPLSLVVLPFENLSGDKEQDYFQ